MNLIKLQLTNFRNHPNLKLKLSPLTVIIGPNGAGKTNILEAIALLSTTRSSRTAREKEVIRWGEAVARIEARLENGKKTSLAMAISAEPRVQKTYFIDQKPHRALDLLGIIPTVLFSPESQELIYGPPSIRRQFLDILICQTDHIYPKILWQYHRVVKSRNRLLERVNLNLAKRDELDFWDQELVALGTDIIKIRQKTATFLTQHITEAYGAILGQPNNLTVQYKPSVDPADFMKILIANRQKELLQGTTLYGPHRDDLLFYLHKRPFATHGSRGESRSAVLALKMAELAYHRQQSSEQPLLLLDDVFSELDWSRREHLSDLMTNQPTIITTTDQDILNQTLKKQAYIINLPLSKDKESDGTN